MTDQKADQLTVEVRNRLLKDFQFWAKHCAKIRTKKGKIVPLVLNAVQRRFLKALLRQWAKTGRVRLVILKARQQGLSTVVSAFLYWWMSQHSAHKGLVMAHVGDSTSALFDMYKRLHANNPEMLRPSTKYSNKTELTFDKLDTGLRVATAGGQGVARGETLQGIHLSEVGFWPIAFAEKNFNGMIEAVPEEDDTFAFVESTANGMTGKFRKLWVDTGKGENVFEQFFAAWFETPEYRNDNYERPFVRTHDEQKLVDDMHAYCQSIGIPDIDDGQLYWRRLKIGEKGIDLFKQEYPATPDEAFLNTGRPIFNPETLLERLNNPPKPVRQMAVFNGKLDDNPRGELLVYVDHAELDTYGNPTGRRVIVSPSETYCIGADVGMGVPGGDYSVAQILDSNLRQVAVWRGRIHPDAFAQVLITLGYYFNTAMLAPERNNHGLLTCVAIRDANYPLIYTDVGEGALEDKDTILIGHLTNEKTKPLIIDKLRAVDRDKQIEIYDETTLREMQSFVVTESGKMEAEPGQHDDTVLALAIANHIHEGKWVPVPVTDDHYADAI